MKIVYQGKTQKDKEILIRYPQKNDAKIMLDYINTLSLERTFIRFQGEKISLKAETAYLNNQLKRIAKKQSVQLLVFSQGKLVGISEINIGDKTEKHLGLLGISVAKEFRGQGIGRKLLEFVIKEAIKNLTDLEIITLGVFAKNVLAKRLYQSFGFIEYGNLPKGVKLTDGYDDHIYMYKVMKK